MVSADVMGAAPSEVVRHALVGAGTVQPYGQGDLNFDPGVSGSITIMGNSDNSVTTKDCVVWPGSAGASTCGALPGA
jgi:hypothetical protein